MLTFVSQVILAIHLILLSVFAKGAFVHPRFVLIPVLLASTSGRAHKVETCKEGCNCDNQEIQIASHIRQNYSYQSN